MRLDEGTCNRQPSATSAAWLTRTGFVEAIEGVENVCFMLRWNSNNCIMNGNRALAKHDPINPARTHANIMARSFWLSPIIPYKLDLLEVKFEK